jgi:two-component system, OmpR family, response regulator TrcR
MERSSPFNSPAMDNINVLLVEDESVLAMVIRETLTPLGFDFSIAANGVEGWSLFHSVKPDICVVDIMMPRKDGLSLVADIRQVDELVPIIFLTARTQTADVLKGFETGADDYMKKPFSMEELIYRLRSQLRRRPPGSPDPGASGPSVIGVGGFQFDRQRLELMHAGKSTSLSQREADLLALLLQHKNNLLDRRTALLKIWGDDNVFNARSMDVYITRLRKYLQLDPRVEIVNIRGQGYKLID